MRFSLTVTALKERAKALLLSPETPSDIQEALERAYTGPLYLTPYQILALYNLQDAELNQSLIDLAWHEQSFRKKLIDLSRSKAHSQTVWKMATAYYEKASTKADTLKTADAIMMSLGQQVLFESHAFREAFAVDLRTALEQKTGSLYGVIAFKPSTVFQTLLYSHDTLKDPHTRDLLMSAIAEGHLSPRGVKNYCRWAKSPFRIFDRVLLGLFGEKYFSRRNKHIPPSRAFLNELETALKKAKYSTAAISKQMHITPSVPPVEPLEEKTHLHQQTREHASQYVSDVTADERNTDRKVLPVVSIEIVPPQPQTPNIMETKYPDTPESIKNAFPDTPESIKNPYPDTPESVKNAFPETPESIKNPYPDTPESVKNAFPETPESIKNAFPDTPESVRGTEDAPKVFVKLQTTDGTEQLLAIPMDQAKAFAEKMMFQTQVPLTPVQSARIEEITGSVDGIPSTPTDFETPPAVKIRAPMANTAKQPRKLDFSKTPISPITDARIVEIPSTPPRTPM